MALFPASGLAPAPMNMRVHRQKEVYKVRKRDRSVAHLFVHERSSCGRDSGARRDVGTRRLNGRGLATARLFSPTRLPCSQRYSSLTEALSTSGCTSRTQLRQLAEHEKPCCQAALASFFTEQSTKLLPLCSQLRTRPRSQDKCLLMWPAILSMSMLDTGNTFFKAASGLMMRPSDNLFLCEKNSIHHLDEF